MNEIDWFKEIQSACDFLSGENVKNLQHLLSKKDTPQSDFLALLSPPQLTLISSLTSEEVELSGDYPIQVREKLTLLKKLALEKVPDIFTHPSIVQIVSEAIANSEFESAEEELQKEWNRVMQITASYWYGGEPGALDIWTRLSFKGLNDSLLLETTASFRDVTFLASNLIGLLKNNLSRAIALQERDWLSEDGIEPSTELIPQLIADAKEIEVLLAKIKAISDKKIGSK